MGVQLSFDLPAPKARRTDPATSHAAAARSECFSGSHADRILAALKKHGPASAHKLEKLTGLSVVQIDRRCCELQRKGLIELVMAGGAPLTFGGSRVWGAA